MQDVQPVRVGLALALLLVAIPVAAAPARAPIVITLVVDQLGASIATARWPLLPDSGGFARLRREGTVGTIVYEHAVTDTAPGHATLYTGAPPRESGVYANELLDPKTRKKVSILRDPATHVIAADGKPRESPSSSAAALRLPTLADAERSARTATRRSCRSRSRIARRCPAAAARRRRRCGSTPASAAS